jgi:hypothetical protein
VTCRAASGGTQNGSVIIQSIADEASVPVKPRKLICTGAGRSCRTLSTEPAVNPVRSNATSIPSSRIASAISKKSTTS